MHSEANTCAEVLHLARADIGSEDDDGVSEVHGAPLSVGEASLVKYLQEDIEDIGMCFLYLVEEYDGVRFAQYGFRQFAAILVGDISRRGSHEQ